MGPNHVLDKGFQATTAVEQFRAVTLVSNDQVKRADAAAQLVIGIAQENITTADATSGRIANIRLMGISRAINGTAGALARNTKVAVDNVGRVVAATAGQNCVGITMTAATAQGDHVDVLINQGISG